MSTIAFSEPAEISDSFTVDYLKCTGLKIFANENFELAIGSLLMDQRNPQAPMPLSIQVNLTPLQYTQQNERPQCQVFKAWIDASNKLQHSSASSNCGERRD